MGYLVGDGVKMKKKEKEKKLQWGAVSEYCFFLWGEGGGCCKVTEDEWAGEEG